MSRDRTTGRRSPHRAFRPQLDDTLEERSLMSAASFSPYAMLAARGRLSAQRVGYSHTSPLTNLNLHRSIRAFTAFGGQGAVIYDSDGERYKVSVSSPGIESNLATVRASPAPNGQVDLVVYGSTPSTELVIDPITPYHIRGLAHTFPQHSPLHDGLLHINSIKVDTGRIGQILGYRTADLSGPIEVLDTSPVNRIALASLKPGASITTGGDLGTLNIFDRIDLGGGSGINIGQDLNLLTVGGGIAISGGSSIIVARDLGAIAQGATGSSPGGAGGSVDGSVVIGDGGSQILVTRALASPFLIRGNLINSSEFHVGAGEGNVLVLGDAVP